MNIDFYVFNPTGNVTALVASPVLPANRLNITREILTAQKDVEQVGFILSSGNKSITVRMSGGEFCGNAAMCAGVYYANENALDSAEISVLFEGMDKPVFVSASRITADTFEGVVSMPPPMRIYERSFEAEGEIFTFPTVEYDNITHIICEKNFRMDFAKRAVKKWCSDLSAKSLGIMFLKDNEITPLVFVRESDTLFLEGSCASGTAAVGEYLYNKGNGSLDLSFNEPKGILRVKKECPEKLLLSGFVKTVFL